MELELVQEWTREHLLAEGAEPLAIVGKLKGEENPVLFAASVRRFLDLAPDWYKRSRSEEDSFKILREAVSETGVLVMQNGVVGRNTHRPLNIEEFRAFSMVDQYAPLIFINAADSNVIARRAMDTGKIDKALYQKIARRAIEQYRRQKLEKKENRGNYYATLCSRIDQRFLRMLAQNDAGIKL